MKIYIRIGLIVLILILFSACGKHEDQSGSILTAFSSFRDVPGVTANEVRAIEAFQKQGVSFVLGMHPTTETFEENGEVMGYTVLLCEWLTELFGVPFEPLMIEWGELIAGLDSFEIDFTATLTSNEERLKTYLMTDAIAEKTVKYFRIEGSAPLEEIARQRPLRYAFLEGAVTFDDISPFVTDEFESFFVNDYGLAYNMLKRGDVDAFFDENPAEASFDRYGDVIADDFFPPLFSPVSLATKNPALEPIISVMQKALHSGGINDMVDLYAGGQQEYAKHKLLGQLSEEERRYIQEHPVIYFAAETDNYPVSFFNLQERQWQGIAIDILREIENLTGMIFEIANDENSERPALLEMLEDGRVSLVTELIFSKENESRFLWSKIPLMVDYPALISRSDYHNISLNEIIYTRVGLVKGYVHTYLFRLWFPEHPNSVEYDTTLHAFNALGRGEVDAVMTNSHELLILTHYLERTGYKTNYLFDNYPFNSAFGINKDEAVLCSIIDKALSLINISRVSDQWLHRTYDYRSKLVEVQRLWFIGLSVLFLTVLFLVIVIFIRNRRAGKKLEKLVNERTHKLQIQTTMLNTLFNAIPDFVFCKNLKLRYTRYNKSISDFMGISSEDAIGKTDMDLFQFSPEVAEIHSKEDLNVIGTKEPIVLEESIVSQIDGKKKILVETIKVPLINDGEVIGVMGISRDITGRKEMEEAAQAASRSKTAFIANMSHEIRTPMNSIMGFTELALDSELSPKNRDYLEKIYLNAEWLLSIINDMLDISKIEYGKMELEHIPFDLHELFVGCRAVIMPKAVEKGIVLYLYAEPSIGKKPLGDPIRLRQVFVNLLSNAVKFTNTGMVKVISKLKKYDEGSMTMHFEIEDTGIGMTTEQIEKIFEPFMQAETGTTRQYGGTGLGLSITRNIVELMGGKIVVESTPGVGSKFSFDLTFDTVDVDELLEQKMVFDEIEKPLFEGEVLLCEDNIMNQQVICEHLSRVGLKTKVADNGKIGVEMIQDRKQEGRQFDLVFMDVHMPVMDGLEAAEKILKIDPYLPIVAMTANVMESDKETYKQTGMRDCIGKPFTSQELWYCLLKYFNPVKPIEKKTLKVEPVMFDSEFDKQLKKLFIENNGNKIEEITEALKAGDIKLAHRLAHSLKGNAGQLGKTVLQQAAADVESRLKGGENMVTPQQLALLGTELNVVLAQFEPEASPLSETSESADKGKPLDAKAAYELIEKLEPMLEFGNQESQALIGSIRRIPAEETLLQRLISQIEDFDFKEAAGTLAELKLEVLR